VRAPTIWRGIVAITVKSATDSARRWSTNAGAASGEYADQAEAAAEEWERGAAAAGANFKQAISAGDIQRRFEAGVRGAGAAKYRRKVRDVGAGRYGSGVAAAESDYADGVEPYLREIAGISLPARKPRGDSGNIQRVSVIADALHKRRLAASAAGR